MLHVCMHVCAYVGMRVCVYACMYVCMHVCMCVCMDPTPVHGPPVDLSKVKVRMRSGSHSVSSTTRGEGAVGGSAARQRDGRGECQSVHSRVDVWWRFWTVK